MTTAPRPARHPLTEDELDSLCAECGEPLGEEAPVLHWHEDQLVFAYYHPGCPPVDYLR
jgi:hypothetical protein